MLPIALASIAPRVRAQGMSPKVAAEALFEEGRKLVAQGKYAEACPKFADSQKIDPSPATLLNLANCYEKLGRNASAWATYKEAASAASAANRQDYVATAQKHADALAPKLTRVTLAADKPVDGMEIKRDGAVVSRSEWATAIPLDPGKHTIEASAPGKKPWSSSFDVKDDGVPQTVTIPAFEDAPVTAPPPPQSPPPQSPPVQPPLQPAPQLVPDTSSDGSGQRLLGWIVGGVGVAGLGAGAFFAVMAKSKYSDSLANCTTADKNLCTQTGVDQRDDARSAGDIATIALGAGAALAVGGVVLVLTAPSQRAEAPRVASLQIAPTIGGAVLRGTW
jgi:hypothetical protein